MGRFLERYMRGECKQVWDELTTLGASVQEEPLHSDALAVARETMRRTRKNITTLIDRLESIGYKFGYDWADASQIDEVRSVPPLLGVPASDIQDRIAQLARVGAVLPLSLRAFYEIVGAVNFVGVRTTAMDTFEYGNDAIVEDEEPTERIDEELNPLYITALDKTLTPEGYLAFRRIEDEEVPYTLVVTRDAPSKYFLSDVGAFLLEIPCLAADARMLFEDGYGMTFVEYLRHSFRHGGLPPASDEPVLAEKTLDYLTRDLFPI